MPWAYDVLCMDCSATQVPKGSVQTLCRGGGGGKQHVFSFSDKNTMFVSSFII